MAPSTLVDIAGRQRSSATLREAANMEIALLLHGRTASAPADAETRLAGTAA